MPRFILSHLDPEAEELLVAIVELAADVPRPQQQFLVTRPLSSKGSAVVTCAGKQIEAAPQDLKALKREALTETTGPVQVSSGSYTFHLTHKATALARSIKGRGEPLEDMENEPVRYIEAGEFRSRYPEAARKWTHAARLLAEDPIENATRIGHDCREALAAFASGLLDRHGAQVFDAGGGTVDSIRAVIKRHRAELGGRVSAFLDALVTYWGTVSDLAQRQEHAAQREAEALTALDARRVVCHTAIVMYELHVTFD